MFVSGFKSQLLELHIAWWYLVCGFLPEVIMQGLHLWEMILFDNRTYYPVCLWRNAVCFMYECCSFVLIFKILHGFCACIVLKFHRKRYEIVLKQANFVASQISVGFEVVVYLSRLSAVLACIIFCLIYVICMSGVINLNKEQLIIKAHSCELKQVLVYQSNKSVYHCYVNYNSPQPLKLIFGTIVVCDVRLPGKFSLHSYHLGVV